MKFDPEISADSCPEVYDPSEDTFLLIQAIDVQQGESVLEIGCGNGIVSLHCAKAGASVTSTDISEKAVECTKMNSEKNSLPLRIFQSDLFEKINDKYDLIIFNPPYLPSGDPDDLKWSGGESGIEVTLEFLRQCKDHLRKDGRVTTIVSSIADNEKFHSSITEIGFEAKTVLRKDLFFEKLFVVEFRTRN